jgi:hypothetical protein
MNTMWKAVFTSTIICLLVLMSFISISCSHPDPIFNIGNGYDETVTVYFEGQKMGKINSADSKIFYPNEVLDTDNTDLLVELKSDTGEILFSKLYTWDELTTVLESVKGEPYWIGNEE